MSVSRTALKSLARSSASKAIVAPSAYSATKFTREQSTTSIPNFSSYKKKNANIDTSRAFSYFMTGTYGVLFAVSTTYVTAHTFPTLLPQRRLALPSRFLDLPLRKDILHRAVVYERDALRQGTASTKTRAEVSGSTRKIRQQKGSGKARLGDRTSPMLRGGGRAHGPKPRDFSTELPRKVYHLAMRGAFSYLFQTGKLTVVDGPMEFPSHKTAFSVEFLEAHGFARGKEPIGGRTLLITASQRKNLEIASANVGYLMETVRLEELLISEVLKYPRVLIEKKALLELEEFTRNENKYKNIVVDQGTSIPATAAET